VSQRKKNDRDKDEKHAKRKKEKKRQSFLSYLSFEKKKGAVSISILGSLPGEREKKKKGEFLPLYLSMGKGEAFGK